ncbi:hypothetical protein [Paraflavitalea speifideaquila]|uniref:hypothetical protein n=1 Tax=Paraflavitalea speifideaquila TaxID=3076558 RepID=UPI0028E194C8|nr:hypothetical protein [Paraflavitalea speifideiaquila]
MSSHHLTDSEIQQYLDGVLAKDSPLNEHLQDCPACRLQVSFYKEIFTVIEQNLPVSTDTLLPDIIMANIMTSAKNKAGRSQVIILYGIALAVPASILFLFGRGLAQAFSGIIELFGQHQYIQFFSVFLFSGTLLLFFSIA